MMSFVCTLHLLPATGFSQFEIGIKVLSDVLIDTIIKSEA